MGAYVFLHDPGMATLPVKLGEVSLLLVASLLVA